MSHDGAHFTGRQIVITLLALLLLTAASWGLAHAPLGAFHTLVALGIAALKAGLVASVFMELAHGSTAQRAVLLVTVLFIALLGAGTVADVVLR